MTRAHQGPTSTPERLIDVASRLFAETSVDAVSIRAITRAANVGPASVHYHFGGKGVLLDAVLARHGQEVLSRIEEREVVLLQQEEAPSAREIVECIAKPYFDLLDREPHSGAEWLSIVGQLALLDDERALRGAEDTTALLHALVARSFPATSIERRQAATMVAVLGLITLIGKMHAKPNRPPTRPGVKEVLVDFVAGGLARSATEAFAPGAQAALDEPTG